MDLIRPILKSTKHSPDFREWIPSTFEGFLQELKHIANSCEGNDPLPLFRGQSNYKWLVDSTLVRNSIKKIFDLPDHHKLSREIRQSNSFHRTIASIILLKFGTVAKPNQEAIEQEKNHDIDPWFELLKDLQQHPENDHFINGTFLLDWSCSRDISLYFANYQGKGEERIVSAEHGAVWIYDAGARGTILMTKKIGQILSLMGGEDFMNGYKTFPLLFHPQKQTIKPRARNQKPVYLAQMDFRYDVADIWAAYENQNNKRVFIKLILNENLKNSSAEYLEKRGVNEEFVYPE